MTRKYTRTTTLTGTGPQPTQGDLITAIQDLTAAVDRLAALIDRATVTRKETTELQFRFVEED